MSVFFGTQDWTQDMCFRSLSASVSEHAACQNMSMPAETTHATAGSEHPQTLKQQS